MNCKRCGNPADGTEPIIVSGHSLHLCFICGDLLWGWLGFALSPPEPLQLPEPPVSLYYEE